MKQIKNFVVMEQPELHFEHLCVSQKTADITHPGDGQGLVEVLSSCQAETPGGRPIQHNV